MSDKAERLHNLATKLRDALQQIEIQGVNKASVPAYPLWQTFEPIALEVGASGYAELRDRFISLCNGIRTEVAVIPLRKETVRQSWLDCLDIFSAVFDASNFGEASNKVFHRHFSIRNLEILDSISERLQNENNLESSPEELRDALNAVRDVIKILENSGELDTRITSILKHYLQQMESVYNQIDDFGDDVFWQVYKETFATFVQIHPVVAGIKEFEEYQSKFKIVMDKLTEKSLFGISLAANVVTIGAPLAPLLLGYAGGASC